MKRPDLIKIEGGSKNKESLKNAIFPLILALTIILLIILKF